MGLDTSHDAYHGGYAGYSILREALMRAAGFRITDGYPPRAEWDGSPLVSDDDPEENTDRPVWNRVEFGEVDRDEWPWDPILYLWPHSDCEGIIPWRMAGAIADRIDEVLPDVDRVTHDFAPGWVIGSVDGRNTTTKAEQFRDGLRRAFEAQEDVEYY